MKKWLRRFRGILGTATLWGGGGAVLGAVLGGVTGMVIGAPILNWALDGAFQLGALGFAMGGGFAVLLTAIDGGRRLAELSVGRAAVWGASAGFSLSALGWVLAASAIPVLPVAIATGLGAVLGGMSVSIARSDLRNLPRESQPPHKMLSRGTS